MEIVCLAYGDGHYYPTTNRIDNNFLEKIAFLLTDDVGWRWAGSFKESILNNTCHTIHGNMLRLEKKGEIILISDGYIKDDEERLQWAIEIKRDELAKIFDQWAEICEAMPPYFVILREGDSVTLKSYQTLEEVNALRSNL